MYRYYKRHIDGRFAVVFDNPLCGVVDDNIYKTKREAKARVKEMNDLLKQVKITAFNGFPCYLWDNYPPTERNANRERKNSIKSNKT